LESHKSEDSLYIMMDGSMLYTRDSEWKELKLGRIFYDSQVVDIQKDRSEIMDSVYVSHLGSVDGFFPKFERHLVGYKSKVIMGDGAKWIWNWAEDNYPRSHTDTGLLSRQRKVGHLCPTSIQRRTSTFRLAKGAVRQIAE